MALPQTDAAVHLNSALHYAEVDMYSLMLSSSRSLLDFGDPGSTLLAVRHRIQKIISVQPSCEHLATLQSIKQVQEAEREGRLKFVQPEIGRVNKKNKPTDKKSRENWPRYYQQVWEEHPEYKPDLVLINGPFPLATSLEALLHIGPQTRLLVHRGMASRRFDILLNFCTMEKMVQQLGVFRPKSEDQQDRELLQELLQQFAYRPRD